jgi:uncharacterized protein YhaN
MRILNIDIDGYGVWSGLRIERLSDSLNVFYGPNEAGKTTLLQFLRSVLYGFSPARQRYLPPVHGGRAGGTLDVNSPHGRFQISRHDSTAEGVPGEQLTLTAPDGTRQGEHFVKVLLSNVDEAVFNNVFAVGLTEMQELATLSDTEAAQLLYNLTAGLDRVSLVEVLQELETGRNRILDAAGRPSQILQLVAEHEKLRAEIEELGDVNHRYGHLAAERDQLHAEVTHLEEETNRVERLARVADLALVLRDRWIQRASLDEQLSAIGSLKVMPDGAVERLDAVNARIQKHQQRLDAMAQRRKALRREYAGLPVSESLSRQAARIEALKEQEPWLAQLQGQIADLEKETGELVSALTAESERLGLGTPKGTEDVFAKTPYDVPQPFSKTSSVPVPLPDLSSRRVASLRSPAKVLLQERRRLNEARQAAQQADESVRALAKQVGSSLATRGQSDLSSALDSAGNVVSQFRRRIQLDERLDQLKQHQTELEERSRKLSEHQLLPVNVLLVLGGVFIAGFVLLLAGLFRPGTITGTVGWGMSLLGLFGIVAVVLGKRMIERSHAQQLDSCQRQLATLQSQIQQTNDDRDALDAQLPRGGAALASRLQAAQADLASLENLASLDADRATAKQNADAAGRRADEAQAAFKMARRRWREALSAAGLPATVAPKQARRLVERAAWIAETQRRLAGRREELARRKAELDSLAARIAQLASEAGVSLAAASLLGKLQELAAAAAKQQAATQRRETIRRDARRIRAGQNKREEAIARQKHRRRELFLEVGVNNEQEFRQRALEYARTDVLRRQRDELAREIENALGSECSEDAIRQQLDGNQAIPLEKRASELRGRLTGIQSQLRDMLEKRGRLSEQLESLAADRRLASKQLDLALLETRLEEAIGRWQVLATTCCVLDMIRDTYQRHRQPETLREASGYLDRLTQGRYCRVWTPLGEHSLRVDDAEGHVLPVESLSRGTREQLFLSLRLALASSYARRGAPLPLVLDDVLVNFDADRAKAAGAVLRDFAAAGHQLLVFTCHEHLHKLFKSLRVPISQLPNNARPGPTVITLESFAEEKPKRQRQKPPRRKIAARHEIPSEDEGFREDGADEEIATGYDDEPDEEESLWEAEDDQQAGDLDDDVAAA